MMDILIVGCGIAGSSLASFLLVNATDAQRKTMKITILERASELRPYGQNIDVRGYGVEMLRKLDLEAAVRASTTGEEGVQLVDAYHRVWASIAADKTGKIQTPTSDIEILRGRLAQLCWKRSMQLSDECQASGGHGISYVFGDSLSAIEHIGDKAQVTFTKSGQKQAYDIVVGADGSQSQTRALAWGAAQEATAVHSLNVYGAFFSIPREEHDTKWRKWFHATGGRAIMLRPDDCGKRSTIFMTVMNDTDARLPVAGKKHNNMSEKKALMEEYFTGAGWETERILREMADAEDFYFDALVQIKMERWSTGRVVLLGDAGYCASPMSGMGTTLAFTGAHSLARAILRRQDSLEQVFAEYEAEMRPIATKAQKLAPGMPRMMHPQALWELVLLHGLLFILKNSGIFTILGMLFGPPANKISLEKHSSVQ
ncbi:oxidoreductase [Akanthomyces lecanii RCEF 1005]|uniref:Oxidoreductase n=1 Tax=Akanthomyces lecanii RCEF 1005 TaxID=1081108 RepID=A0A162KR90_CORDF|nr:oxidoreductase [Akanthomyces lecanii RCEF 1005]